MECKFCGTNFNAHACPNCGAAAHEPPKADQPDGYPHQPVYHSSWGKGIDRPPPRHSPRNRPPTRGGRRSMLLLVLPLIMLLFLPTFIQSMASGNGTAAYSSPPAGGANSMAAAASRAAAQSSAASGAAEHVDEYRYTGTPAFQALSEEAYKAQATFLDFDVVRRSPVAYYGADMYITLEISQVDENEDTGTIRYIGYAIYPDGTFPTWEDDPGHRRVIVYDRENTGTRYYKGEFITAYGDFVTVEELKGQLLGTFAMPAMNGRYFELAEVGAGTE